MSITIEEATEQLTARWHEQVRLFPTMALDVPLSLYVRRNLGVVRRHALLQDYAPEGSRVVAIVY